MYFGIESKSFFCYNIFAKTGGKIKWIKIDLISGFLGSGKTPL